MTLTTILFISCSTSPSSESKREQVLNQGLQDARNQIGSTSGFTKYTLKHDYYDDNNYFVATEARELYIKDSEFKEIVVQVYDTFR